MNFWQHRRPVRRSRLVDVASIGEHAVPLLDEGGLAALTVRGLAQRMGVAPASLYSRVTSVEDIFDIALDTALGSDEDLVAQLAGSSIQELMLTFYRHLVAHPWAPRVIGKRAPRGPNFLRLSERMVVLLAEQDALNPLAVAYTLSNFVIGSATTAPMVHSERASDIDPDLAPRYADLHARQDLDAEANLRAGLQALIEQVRIAPPGPAHPPSRP